MPATHLISVDLPAPLSPTSAITSPRCTAKSTSVSACTDPNDLDTPRSSSRGASLMRGVSYHTTSRGARVGASAEVRCPCVLLAVLLVVAAADLGLLEEASLGQDPPVRLRDCLRRDQEGRLPAAALGVDESRRRRLL